MFMMRGPDLHWLPRPSTWSQDLASAQSGTTAWPVLCALARARIDALETRSLDRKRQRLVTNLPEVMAAPPIRLAVLASSTVDHLLPAIRVAGMRRDLWIETYTPDYGQHTQALIDPASPLSAFCPTAVLFAFDSHHLLAGIEPGGDAAEIERRIAGIGENLAAQW